MLVAAKDGTCRECGGQLKVIGADDATMRLHLAQILAKHEQSGIPFEVLLGGTPPNAHRQRGRAWQSTADQADDAATATIPKAPLIVLPVASTIDDLDPEPSACAAEPPPSAGSRSAAGRAASTSGATRRAERGSPPSEELVEQLRETCDEIRVLWQAVDEIRESLEHTLRNVPELDEPARPPSIPDVESDVEDLLKRLQQLPPALLADLQSRLATMNQSPSEPSPVETPPNPPVRSPPPSTPANPEDNGRFTKHASGSASRYRIQKRLF